MGLMQTIPLNKLNCHHCTRWHNECPGIQYRGLDKSGDTYCVSIFSNYSEQSIDGKESTWLEIPKKGEARGHQ